jgi:hypothetical protein
VNLRHPPENQFIEPLGLGHITPLVLLHKLKCHPTSAYNHSTDSKGLTFSNLPISSLTSDLLGVVVSTLPSASLPCHNNSRCFPLRSVLPIPSTSCQCRVYNTRPGHNTPFLAEQPESRTTYRRRCTRPCYIPYSKCDLGAEREVTVAYRQRNPLVPPSRKGQSGFRKWRL